MRLFVALEVHVGDVVFVDVNVVPMDSERVVRGQTVVVRDGRIARVGPADAIDVPEAAEVIEGRGRWLMPGLADMHAHYGSRDAAALFLANGVTTVRVMWGRPEHLEERDRAVSGERVAPTIVCGSPIVDGDPPTWGGMIKVGSPEQVEETLDAQVAAGYEFIKIYNLVSPPVFDAMMEWSKSRGVQVAGHLPHAVGLERALRGGMASVEHVHASYKEALRDDSPVRGKVIDNGTLIEHAHEVDARRFSEIAAMASELGGTFCPTLVVNERISRLDRREEMMSMPELRYVHPAVIDGWDPHKDRRFQAGGGPSEAGFAGLREVARLGPPLVRALRDAVARLLLGTDETNPFIVAGFSVHDELSLLVEAGLSPYEALRAGTATPAEFLGQAGEFGVVAERARADLVLVEGNPLEDVGNARLPAGVMVRGRWLEREELDGILEAVAEKVAS
jgi:imidazolonepropionase-like amidohydrolase